MRARFIIGVALALLVVSCGGNEEAQPTVTTGQAGTTSSTTSSSTTTAAPSGGWFRVPQDEAVFGSGAGGVWTAMRAVTGGGPGLVAVGYDGSGGDWDAAVWTSADGLAWSRVPGDETTLGGEGDQDMAAVVAGGPGLVAVGAEYLGEDWDAAVWTSADGLAWSRVPHDEGLFGGPDHQFITGVVAGGPGLIAVGSDRAGGDTDGAVWTSADGITWMRIQDEDLGGEWDQSLVAICAGGPGFVVVGEAFGSEGLDAAVWTSPDGLSWDRVPHDAAIFGGPGNQAMSAVAPGGPGLIAGGYDDATASDMDAAVWTSPDGLLWARIPHDEVTFGGSGDQWVAGLAVLGDEIVAAGGGAAPGGAAAVWTSPDGALWSLLPYDEAVFDSGEWQDIRGVVVGGPGLVAVGSEGVGEGAHAAAWAYRAAG
jgi:hypothetical protein